MLTGKCKEDFENWWTFEVPTLGNTFFEGRLFNTQLHNGEYFYTIPFSMQYGVYVDFFDSVGIEISMDRLFLYGINMGFSIDVLCKNGRNDYFECGSRAEARQKAIEKANDIYNVK